MNGWLILLWIFLLAASSVFHLFALLELYSVWTSSAVLILTLFIFLSWLTGKKRFFNTRKPRIKR